MSFKDGIPNFEIAQQGKETKETGTIVEFSPNKQVFHMKPEEKCFEYNRIRDELELTSYFIPNVTFTITCGKKKEKFFSKNGLKDFAATHIKKPLHKNFIYGYKHFDDEVEVEVFAQWTAGKEEAYVFSNGALNSEGGTPITGAKTAFTRTINTLSKGEFDADMIRKGLVYIVNVRHPRPIYQNQVKNKIQNPELRGYTQTVFGEAIKDFVAKNKNDFEKIVELLTKEKKAEAAAERARRQVLEATKDIEKNQKKKVFASDKLKDAEYLGENSILLIVEGNSAAASMAIARDITKYGSFAIRGKMLNCLAHPEEKIFQNEEIKTL
jgi:DNA gyrase subunit B